MGAVDATWRKSTYSGGSGSECVEAGVVNPGRVMVRDTKTRDGVTLSVPDYAWRAFTAALK